MNRVIEHDNGDLELFLDAIDEVQALFEAKLAIKDHLLTQKDKPCWRKDFGQI